MPKIKSTSVHSLIRAILDLNGPRGPAIDDGVRFRHVNRAVRAPKARSATAKRRAMGQLREFVRVATEIGITDVSELTEIFNATSNEDLRAKMVENVELITQPLEKWRALMKQFLALVDGRSTIAAEQYQAEIILLERIQKLGKEAETGEELLELPAAYAQLRATSVAPGWYYPDVRHTDKPDPQEQQHFTKLTPLCS